MDIGFFHPERGYWQAIDVSKDLFTVEVEPERIEVEELEPARIEVDENGNETVIPAVIRETVIPAVTRETSQYAELLATYPAGTVEVALKPGADFEWQEGEWVHAPPPLEDVKAELKVRLDADAEVVRLHYITPGAGQAMAYLQKAAEAAACLADTDPGPADYPLLAAEIGITAETLVGVATIVHAQHQAWRNIGGQIEAARLAGKAAIDAALTIDNAQAAFDAVEWPAA